MNGLVRGLFSPALRSGGWLSGGEQLLRLLHTGYAHAKRRRAASCSEPCVGVIGPAAAAAAAAGIATSTLHVVVVNGATDRSLPPPTMRHCLNFHHIVSPGTVAGTAAIRRGTWSE